MIKIAAFLVLLAAAIPPVPTTYVTDRAHALSDSTRTALDAKLKAYEHGSGHQVIVWIGDTTGGQPLESFTADAAHQWKIGRKGLYDGAVLFLFMRDHRVRIEVGYGLEGKLTDADSKRIIDNTIVPAMRAGDTDRAVSGGVDAIIATVAGEAPAQAPTSSSAPGWLLAIVLIVIVIAVIAFILAIVISIVLAVGRSGGKGSSSALAGAAIGAAATNDSWLSSSSTSSSSDDSFSSSSDSDFSSGGGDFGGGGASGSW